MYTLSFVFKMHLYDTNIYIKMITLQIHSKNTYMKSYIPVFKRKITTVRILLYNREYNSMLTTMHIHTIFRKSYLCQQKNTHSIRIQKDHEKCRSILPKAEPRAP